jgi:hypothetical protein
MKKIEITHGTVIPFYGTDEVIKEFQTEAGTIMSFNVKTPMMDTPENKGFLFIKVSTFIKSADRVKAIREIVTLNSILNLKGYERRTRDKKDEKKWYDEVSITEIIPITSAAPVETVSNVTPDADADLPF